MRGTSIVVALTSATVKFEGRSIAIRKGEAWDAGSVIVRDNASLFSADPSRALGGELGADPEPERLVEQATRAPGQRSNARRAR